MTYRSEIDGLRAIAVLPVIFFHAGLSGFQGGYVGVDVFFVISGYLITSILIKDIDKGRFSLVHFYERRARRILPALYLTCFITIITCYFLMAPWELKLLSESLIYVVFFLSNIFFYSNADTAQYFSPQIELFPLIHTWSLAVEEQFYILFPILLFVLYRINKKIVIPGLIIIATFSLLFTQFGGNLTKTPPFFESDFKLLSQPFLASFYMPFGRIWELLIGSLAAFISRENFSRGTSEFMSFLGIILILISISSYDGSLTYPSAFTLVPVIGTFLLIIYSSPKTLIGSILSMKYLVKAGLISYSLYLLHQPIFVFARLALEREIHLIEYLIIITIAIFLAYFSWAYIEKPCRDKKKMSRRAIFSFSFLGMFFLFLIGLVVFKTDGFKDSYISNYEVKYQSIVSQVINYKTPPFGDALSDKRCKFSFSDLNKFESQFKKCSETHGKATLIFGDSHSVEIYNSIFRNSKDIFLVKFPSKNRLHEIGEFVEYDKNFMELERFFSKFGENINNAIYVQSGHYLLRQGSKDVSRIDFQKEIIKDFDLNLENVKKNDKYLSVLAKKTNVIWLGPYLEPHIDIKEFLKVENIKNPRIKRNIHENYSELDKGIFSFYDKRKSPVKYMSLFEVLKFNIRSDMISSNEQELYWSDTDHFSPYGELYFGKRILDQLGKELDLISD